MKRLSLEIVVGSFNSYGEAEIDVRGETFDGRVLSYRQYVALEHLQNLSLFDLIWRDMGGLLKIELAKVAVRPSLEVKP